MTDEQIAQHDKIVKRVLTMVKDQVLICGTVLPVRGLIWRCTLTVITQDVQHERRPVITASITLDEERNDLLELASPIGHSVKVATNVYDTLNSSQLIQDTNNLTNALRRHCRILGDDWCTRLAKGRPHAIYVEYEEFTPDCRKSPWSVLTHRAVSPSNPQILQLLAATEPLLEMICNKLKVDEDSTRPWHRHGVTCLLTRLNMLRLQANLAEIKRNSLD